MKNYIVLSLLMLSSILYASCDPCTRRVNCPAFDGSYLFGWFPYGEEGKTFYFSDGTSTDTLIIDQITQTEPYRIEYQTGYGKRESDYCDISGTISSKVDDLHPGWLPVIVKHVESAATFYGEEYASITIAQYELEFYISGDDPYDVRETSIYTATNFDQVEVNGTNYNNVFIVTTVDPSVAAQQKIDKLYLAKGKGILGYRTYLDQKEHWLQ